MRIKSDDGWLLCGIELWKCMKTVLGYIHSIMGYKLLRTKTRILIYAMVRQIPTLNRATRIHTLFF